MTGIDYGNGIANIDLVTGIRYGVISPHSVNPDALQDIYDNGKNLTHAAAVADAKARIGSALLPVLDDLGVLPYVGTYTPRSEDVNKRNDAMTDIVDSVWNDIEQDWNDQYQEDNDQYRYEQNGYILENTSLGIYVIKSPFYTRARFCSPCCPGAGDLDSPGTVPTYCLGTDWFDDGQTPYAVYTVSDDTCVFRGPDDNITDDTEVNS